MQYGIFVGDDSTAEVRRNTVTDGQSVGIGVGGAAAVDDARIDSRRAYENHYRLAGDADDESEVDLPKWEPKRDLFKNLARFDVFLAHHPGEAGRLLAAHGDRVASAAGDAKKPAETRVAAGLWVLRLDPAAAVRPEALVTRDFDMNALGKAEQEALLARPNRPITPGNGIFEFVLGQTVFKCDIHIQEDRVRRQLHGEKAIDPLHFGILATVNLAIGYITPPYGATLFVACGIAEQDVRAVSGKVVPILLAMLAVLGVVTYWPDTVLWLPRMAAP